MTDCRDWKLGVSSSCFPLPTPDVVRQYAENGIDCMEISMRYDRYGEVRYSELGRAARENNVTLWSIHLPFDGSVAIAHSDRTVRQKTMLLHSELLKMAGGIGVKHAVIHPGTEPTLPADRDDRLKEARENLHILSEVAEENGVQLCVEELPRTCPGNCSVEISAFLERSPKLWVCFDTNHLLHETHAEFLDAVGSRVRTLHISDYDFVDERHQLPGEGKIEWTPLIHKLETLDYAGPWMYEVHFEPAPGRRTGRVLTLRDFRENFEQLKKNAHA